MNTATLERECSVHARSREWTAPARLQAVITTAALSEDNKNACCRENDIYPAELGQWCASATVGLQRIYGLHSHPGNQVGSICSIRIQV